MSIVAFYLYYKRRSSRRRRGGGLPTTRHDEAERVPLGSERVEMGDMDRTGRYEDEDGQRQRGSKGKGKERARDSDEMEDRETVFALGDDEDR
jgi:carboxypeptidase D